MVKATLTVLTVLLFFSASQAAPPWSKGSCRIISEDGAWSLVDRAESQVGDEFVESVLSVIDWAHPYNFRRIVRHFNPIEILEDPSPSTSYTLLAQLSRLQRFARQKPLTVDQIQRIQNHIVAALDSFGGNGLGRHTGLWILANRTPLGITEQRAKDLRSKEHDYFAYIFRDWTYQPEAGSYSVAELAMQVNFASTLKSPKEKFELYLEAIENAAASQNEEGYMSFAGSLLKSLQSELIYSSSYKLTVPNLIAIFNSLRVNSSNHYYLENSITTGDGFAEFRGTVRRIFAKNLWRDSQTHGWMEEFLKDWEQDITEKIHFVKTQYILRLRPLSNEEVFGLKDRFKRKLSVPNRGET